MDGSRLELRQVVSSDAVNDIGKVFYRCFGGSPAGVTHSHCGEVSREPIGAKR